MTRLTDEPENIIDLCRRTQHMLYQNMDQRMALLHQLEKLGQLAPDYRGLRELQDQLMRDAREYDRIMQQAGQTLGDLADMAEKMSRRIPPMGNLE